MLIYLFCFIILDCSRCQSLSFIEFLLSCCFFPLARPICNFIRPLEKGDCLGKIEQVEKLFFIDNKFSKEKIKLIQGWFENTVPGFSFAGNIAILRLDGDWYESTRIPLENFYSKISIGGIIIIDDYATCHGSKKAVDEFIEINGFKPNLMPDGRGGAWFIKEA